MFAPIAAWTVRNLGHLAVVAALVTVATFLLVRVAPGDAISTAAGARGTDESRAALRAELGLDDPLASQFTSYVAGLFRGDLGTSLGQSRRDVGDIIWPALGLTAPLVLLTLLIAVVVGTIVGLTAGANHGGPLDGIVQGGLSVLLSCPPFFLGLLLILGPALAWGLLPVGGWAGVWPDNVRYLLLPSLALAGFLMPQVARVVRQAAHTARCQLWHEAAVARGLGPRALWGSHVLRNSMLPVVALVGANIGPLIGGAVIVEAVFGLPGLGQELITAVDLRDYPVIQGIALVTAVMVAASGVAADAVGKIVDPRTRRA